MYSVIILGGGSGERMGLGYNKVLYKIKGLTVIEHAAKNFIHDEDFKEVLVVINRDDYDQVKLLFNHPKVRVIKGGNTRQESVYIGLNDLEDTSYVFIHDGARPNISAESIAKIKEKVREGSITLFTKANESLVYHSGNQIDEYINRDFIAMIKTPQAFLYSDIKEAYELAKKNHHEYKDDASVIMKEMGQKVFLIEGEESNIKLTTQLDIKIMEELL